MRHCRLAAGGGTEMDAITKEMEGLEFRPRRKPDFVQFFASVGIVHPQHCHGYVTHVADGSVSFYLMRSDGVRSLGDVEGVAAHEIFGRYFEILGTAPVAGYVARKHTRKRFPEDFRSTTT